MARYWSSENLRLVREDRPISSKGMVPRMRSFRKASSLSENGFPASQRLALADVTRMVLASHAAFLSFEVSQALISSGVIFGVGESVME